MKLLSNLKIPFVILWVGSIGGIIYNTHLDNLKKIEYQKNMEKKEYQKNMKKIDFNDPDFNPFRSY